MGCNQATFVRTYICIYVWYVPTGIYLYIQKEEKKIIHHVSLCCVRFELVLCCSFQRAPVAYLLTLLGWGICQVDYVAF